MKKILFIVILLLLPIQAWGENYYFLVNPYPSVPLLPSYSEQQTNQLMQLGRLNQLNNRIMMDRMATIQMQRYQIEQQRHININWQKFLQDNGYNPGPVDGIWGPRSQKAYEEYMSHQQNLKN